MHQSILVLILFSFLQAVQVSGQTPSYYHYTSSDGLASSTVYQIIQDRNGFVWFATINGMSRFDGKTFTTFRTADGLHSNSIISLAEGRNGELYIGNYEKGINVLRNGHIENYCNEIQGKNFALSYLLLVPDGNDGQKLYAYRSWGTVSSIQEKKTGALITNQVSTHPVFINQLRLLPNNEIVALSPHGLYTFKNDQLIKLPIAGLPDTDMYCLTQATDGTYLIGSKGMIYQVHNKTVVRRYPVNLPEGKNDVNAILRDRNNNLWFSIMNRGFFYLANGSDQIIDMGVKMGLQNTLVNNYLEDSEGNIWLSTYGKGVYCLNHLYLRSYTENDGMSSNNVYSIIGDPSGHLVIGTFNGINIFNHERFDCLKGSSDKTLTEYIFRIQHIDTDFYVCGSFGGSEIKNRVYKGMRFHLIDRTSFCRTSTRHFLFGTGVNSIRVQSDFGHAKNQAALYFIFGTTPCINRINDIFEDTRKNVWLATGLGLCKLSNLNGPITQWKKTFFPSDPVLNAKINVLIQDEDLVWAAGEKGIACYQLQTDSVTSYTHFEGHDLSAATSIVTDNKHRIWIGNMKGLYLMEGNSIQLLNRQTGLPSDEVFSLYFDRVKNLLYIGTSNGISILDINEFDQSVVPEIRVNIQSIQAGDSVYTNFNNLVIEPEQGSVMIRLKAISYSSPGSITYQYRLKDEWKETDHDFLDLASLKNGKYELEIRAKSQQTEWGPTYSLSFHVLPRFVESIWFYLLILSIFGFLSFFMISWRLKSKNKKIRKELELTERINELRHQALSAMMNPHFIFNSLNSVQYLINSQQNEEAIDYIAMMAQLMRKNLDTAGNGFILLSDEIVRLRLYLNLEKLRFQESFSYEIITGTGIEIDSIMIPNMIIQPFVENTLWHGLRNTGKKGLVKILFSFEEIDVDSKLSKSLIIKITDNGIGINEAKKYKKEDHISKGIQIIEERLKLLSAKMMLPQPILLEDLSCRDVNSHGTEVIISLPPQLYKMIPSKKS